MAPTSRGKTCLLATNQSKLEKAQADYDQALGAYNSERELLKKAEERLGKAFEAGVEGERLQFLKDALANAKDAVANAKDVLANAEKDKDRAWQTVELERKQTPQSEASEVAKKYMFVVSIFDRLCSFLSETCSHFWIERHWVVHVLASSVH